MRKSISGFLFIGVTSLLACSSTPASDDSASAQTAGAACVVKDQGAGRRVVLPRLLNGSSGFGLSMLGVDPSEASQVSIGVVLAEFALAAPAGSAPTLTPLTQAVYPLFLSGAPIGSVTVRDVVNNVIVSVGTEPDHQAAIQQARADLAARGVAPCTTFEVNWFEQGASFLGFRDASGVVNLVVVSAFHVPVGASGTIDEVVAMFRGGGKHDAGADASDGGAADAKSLDCATIAKNAVLANHDPDGHRVDVQKEDATDYCVTIDTAPGGFFQLFSVVTDGSENGCQVLRVSEGAEPGSPCDGLGG